MQLFGKVVLFQLIVICVLVLFIIFETLTFSLSGCSEKRRELFNFPQRTYKDGLIDVTKFNYSGICQEAFKYKSNNERDLLIYGVYYKNRSEWLRDKDRVLRALKINKSGIPFAKKVLLLFGDPPEPSFNDVIERTGVNVIPFKFDKVYNGAVLRYVGARKYLEQNREKFDRVFISDFRDMFFFADGFATFSKDQLFMSYECSVDDYSNLTCYDLDNKGLIEWMRNSFNKEIAEGYAKNKTTIINCGGIFGGTEKMVALLDIYTKNINLSKANYWGYDQSLLTYLYYTGQLNHLNITMITCNQMYCFDMRNGCYYDPKNKAVYVRGSKCSPIMRHKLIIDKSKINWW